MKENHTPQREDLTSHRLKESRSKKNQKVVKRSLNTAFTTGTEEVSSEKMSEFSPSAGSDSSVVTITPLVSSEALSDPTISTNSDYPFNMPGEPCVFHKLDGSVEVDIVSSFLKKARNQVINSSDVDKQSKKLVDALLKVVLDECCALPEERDFCAELVSARGRILLLCFLLWSFMFSVIFFFGSLSDRSHYGPLPT